MADINTDGGGKKKHSKKVKRKKLSTRIDLTPMVDLGFLLITFFMLATTLIKPQTMEISMPSKEKVPEEEQTKVKASKAITIILSASDSIYYYFGGRENDIDPKILTADYSANGIRSVLLEKNAPTIIKVNELKLKKDNNQINEADYRKQLIAIKGDAEATVVVIKATKDATYKNMVDILDEMNICNIGMYAIVDINDYDMELIRTRK
jgi:biopolymer transport protein ExbD